MSDGGSTDSSCCDFPDEMDILQEMFPTVCSIEVRRFKWCIKIKFSDFDCYWFNQIILLNAFTIFQR